jgi:hypothetical protein
VTRMVGVGFHGSMFSKGLIEENKVENP